MGKEEKATRERIHEIATAEFLAKGFQGASLRNIVKEAGVTTGSFYWYYSSKEELFDALVGEHYAHVLQMYSDATEAFWQMSKEDQKLHMGFLLWFTNLAASLKILPNFSRLIVVSATQVIIDGNVLKAHA